jgi:hypothetical protein
LPVQALVFKWAACRFGAASNPLGSTSAQKIVFNFDRLAIRTGLSARSCLYVRSRLTHRKPLLRLPGVLKAALIDLKNYSQQLWLSLLITVLIALHVLD